MLGRNGHTADLARRGFRGHPPPQSPAITTSFEYAARQRGGSRRVGTIVAANDTWKEFGRRNGLRIPNWGFGANYLKYSGGKGFRSTRIVRDLKDLLAGRLDLLTAIYPCHSLAGFRFLSRRRFSLCQLGQPRNRKTVCLGYLNQKGTIDIQPISQRAT